VDPLLQHAFVEPMLAALQTAGPGAKPVLALQAPVGAGKTTLSLQLQEQAAQRGLRLAVASVDDAYRPWFERCRHLQGNPFGVTRVPPGSHDPALIARCIERWRRGEPLRLPRFDKRLRGGEGDRCGWSTTQADALLLEGWLMGYEPQPLIALQQWLAGSDHDLSGPEAAWLPHWNGALQAYLPLWQCCDGFWVLQPSDWAQVLHWRLEAEAKQRSSSGSALQPAAIGQMVRATLASLPPALYQPALDARADAVAVLDQGRRCLELRPRCRRP